MTIMRAPGDEMLAAAARIATAVEVPVTVDAEAGYGMEPGELVAAMRSAGAAGCNLEDSDHGSLRDADSHAEWLGAVRQAAVDDGYPLVINARVDVFFGPMLAGAGPGTQEALVPEALQRAKAYVEAGVDCVYPIGLWETDALQPLHVRGPDPGERRTPAAGAVARRAGRVGRVPGELGAAAVLGRDRSLRGPARLASGVRRGDSSDGGVDPVRREIEERSAGNAEAMCQQRRMAPVRVPDVLDDQVRHRDDRREERDDESDREQRDDDYNDEDR